MLTNALFTQTEVACPRILEQCGAGYLQGSFQCSACDVGYFLGTTGICEVCPAVASAWQVRRPEMHFEKKAPLALNKACSPPQRYSGLLFILVAIFAIVCVVYASLFALVCFVGGTITGGLFRKSNLALWALMCAQVRWRGEKDD